MRPRSMIEKGSSQRVFRYSIEAEVEEIHLNIRFPCKLSIHWNYGEGSVTSLKPIPLEKGIAKFQETLSFSANVTFNQQKQEYLEQRTAIEIFILTENGNSLAGFVTFDLGKLVSGTGKKESFQIERCPDRGANLKMKVSYQFLSEKYSKASQMEGSSGYKNRGESRVGGVERVERDKDNSLNQLSDGKTELFNRRVDPQSVKNKELIEREVALLKSRVGEFEGKYKGEKMEREKLNDLLKGKEEVYFTLKTEIKRKEIEIDGMMKSLDEYRAEYQRLKMDNDTLIKTKEKMQSILENIEKSSYERISRLEAENNSLARKCEKVEGELARVTREKETLSTSIKEKSDGSTREKEFFNESTRQLKKEKEDIMRSYKAEKEGYERTVRELNRKIEELEEELGDIKEKYSVSTKKVSKMEEQRIEEITKNNLKLVELEKTKESLSIELSTLKKDVSKKESNSSETNKKLEKQLGEERVSNGRLTQSISDLQSEKKLLGLEIERYKQGWSGLQDTKSKLEKEVEHLKYQTQGLNEMLGAKNNELKLMGVRQKEVAEEFKRRVQELEEKNRECMFQFQVQLREVRRTEQNKYLSATTTTIRKEKDLEDAGVREQKLSMHIETMKEEYKKNQVSWREKVEVLRNNEQHLKQEVLNLCKKKEEGEQDLIEKMREMEIEIHSLNELVGEAKENEFRLLEREDRLRVEKEEIYRIYNELKVSSFQVREELERCQDELEDYHRNEVELNRELESSESQYSRLVQELKEKVLEVEEEKSQLMSQGKERERGANQSIKQLREEVEELRSEVGRREGELKRMEEQHRETLHREKVRMNEVEMDLEKAQNEVGRLNSTSEQKETLLEQFQEQIREYRENIKALMIEREGLLAFKEETESERVDLKESLENFDTQLHSRNKELREMKGRLEERELEIKEGESSRKRNRMLIMDVHEIVCRLSQSELVLEAVSERGEYEELMELRRRLLLVENKVNKEREIAAAGARNSKREMGESLGRIEGLEGEIGRLKGVAANLKRVEEAQLEEMNSMRIENQELMYQMNTLETELITFKSNSSVLDLRLKDECEQARNYEAETKRQLENYQKLLSQTRAELTEKYQKQKKELMGAIRAAEQKVETLEQKNFSLELENKKIEELGKRQEENKRVLGRVYELERENFDLLQKQKEYQERSNSMGEKLEWEQNLLEQSHKNIQSRLEGTISQLQSENSKLSTKNREMATIVREKEFMLEQVEKNLAHVQEQYEEEMNALRAEKERMGDSEFKLKNELLKVKAELGLFKASNEQNKDKLLSLESVSRIKGQLEMELEQKNGRIVELEDREQRLNKEIVKMNQQLQEAKWEWQRVLATKENELMGIQQQLYALNSKENIRMLRQIQFSQKQKLMQLQKKSLLKQITQYKQKYRLSIQNQRNVQFLATRNLQQQQSLILQNEQKHQQIIRILQDEIRNLKNQSHFSPRRPE